MVGAVEGRAVVGFDEGLDVVGVPDGLNVGFVDGLEVVGAPDGRAVVGFVVGTLDGFEVVGDPEGREVDGLDVGLEVVGEGNGAIEGTLVVSLLPPPEGGQVGESDPQVQTSDALLSQETYVPFDNRPCFVGSEQADAFCQETIELLRTTWHDWMQVILHMRSAFGGMSRPRRLHPPRTSRAAVVLNKTIKVHSSKRTILKRMCGS